MTRIHPATGEPSNEQRAEWARSALSSFTIQTYNCRTFRELEEEMEGVEYGDDYTALQDLLSDLMHVATLRGWDVDDLLRLARANYDMEIEMEREASAAD